MNSPNTEESEIVTSGLHVYFLNIDTYDVNFLVQTLEIFIFEIAIPDYEL